MHHPFSRTIAERDHAILYTIYTIEWAFVTLATFICREKLSVEACDSSFDESFPFHGLLAIQVREMTCGGAVCVAIAASVTYHVTY
jgi:hypothetical protein